MDFKQLAHTIGRIAATIEVSPEDKEFWIKNRNNRSNLSPEDEDRMSDIYEHIVRYHKALEAEATKSIQPFAEEFGNAQKELDEILRGIDDGSHDFVDDPNSDYTFIKNRVAKHWPKVKQKVLDAVKHIDAYLAKRLP